MLSKEFLEEKINRLLEMWKGDEEKYRFMGYNHIYMPTQAYETDNGMRFILWNMIGEGFYGHYEVFVNTDTFEYKVKKYGEFGGLTWIRETEDKKVYDRDDLTEPQRLNIEASIAKTIMWCYDKIYESYYSINLVKKD